MRPTNEEQVIKKTLLFLLKTNYLSDYEKHLDSLIAEQGIDSVFDTLYKLFCSYGDVIPKSKKIIDIIQKHSQD